MLEEKLSRLEVPFVNIIGLYTNVPDGGMFDEHQIAWLESELAEAPYALPKVGGEKIKPPFAIPNTDVTLENYCDDRYGYLHIEVSEQTLKVNFFSVLRPQEAWSASAVVQDSFTLDLRNHRLLR